MCIYCRTPCRSVLICASWVLSACFFMLDCYAKHVWLCEHAMVTRAYFFYDFTERPEPLILGGCLSRDRSIDRSRRSYDRVSRTWRMLPNITPTVFHELKNAGSPQPIVGPRNGIGSPGGSANQSPLWRPLQQYPLRTTRGVLVIIDDTQWAQGEREKYSNFRRDVRVTLKSWTVKVETRERMSL